MCPPICALILLYILPYMHTTICDLNITEPHTTICVLYVSDYICILIYIRVLASPAAPEKKIVFKKKP